jgi:putative oxidoreductase
MSALRSILSRPGVVRSAQVAIGVLMGWAALAKLGDLQAFAHQVHNFRVLPIAAENLVAMTLPWVELVAALSLVLAVRPRAGSVVTTVLLAVFTLGVIQAVARGLDFECGCFGTSDASRVGLGKILQNLGMLALAGVGSLTPRTAERSDAVPLQTRTLET